ncbi:hypothetical protein QJS10_CPB18g00769 [Acorus calamus]|uniref:Uncharacterized protein n=1 Tax=Acorus calamus TaxID=4465 RepID=A0AAV9CPT4_ACOCL|nr:hypothetical protein QJS10_CPB18g00769 [Acorus calamus]
MATTGIEWLLHFFGMSNEGWRDVRNDLLLEIEQHPDEYNLLFYGLDRVEEMKRSLRCQSSIVGREHWMTMSKMGYVISSYYKIIVVLISMNQCLTFFPIRDPPPPASSHWILCIGYVGSCHFQGLELTLDAPLPPVTTTWERFHLDNASSWVTPYISRMEVFRSLAGTNVALVDDVDLI